MRRTLENNNIPGPLPPGLFKLVNLRKLYALISIWYLRILMNSLCKNSILTNNNFDSIPSSFGSLVNLEHL